MLFTGAVQSACGLASASIDDEMIKFNMPTVLLPEGVWEGDVLAITITRDEKATEDSEAEVSSLMERLKRKNQEGSGLIQDPEE